MAYLFCNSNDKAYQARLNSLLRDIFLDFQFWYDLNLWDHNYESHAIEEDGRIVANICLYRSQIMFKGKQYPALSVGAVATHQDYRGKGYARQLMDRVIQMNEGVPFYLSANDTVIDFYPRFGFRRVFEKQPVSSCQLDGDQVLQSGKARKLTYSDLLVHHYVYERNGYSQYFDCLNTESVNMFHLYEGYLKNHIYELPDLDTMIVAHQEDDTLKLTAVFSKRTITFSELRDQLPFSGVNRIAFGFMPYWPDLDYDMVETSTDPWFVRNVHCDLGDIKFPELSIT